jgi:two-component system, NtrC family, sensor kinase
MAMVTVGTRSNPDRQMEAITLSRPQIDLESLNTALVRLQRLAGLGTLTAGVSHELSNPISIITATCNTLLSQVADDNLSTDELLSHVQVIDYSAWRCARLLQVLRGYSHVDDSEYVVCDLNHIIEDSLILAAYQISQHDAIKIETELATELPALVCDPYQITQVIINLLINASDALNGHDGTITVSSWSVPVEKAVAFSVRDNGTGIAPNDLDRLFEPFFTTKLIGEGTGLGLSISHEIVQQHHGRISAQNNPDRGATFTVVLPYQ